MIKHILVVAFIIAVSAVGYQIFKDRDIPLEDLKAKYSYPHSQFIEVDGINFHLLDEGNKIDEAVVLIHGHFGSLHMYDGWTDILKEHYRVVRFDITSGYLPSKNARLLLSFYQKRQKVNYLL